MDSWSKSLFEGLHGIQGSGHFLTTGKVPLVLPGLRIKETPEVSFPIKPAEAQRLITLAKAAPFGRGSETITDESVRKAWEIDASALSFHNPAWEDTLARILQSVQTGLGLSQKRIEAHLYKLLIYEEGGFFLPHKDSEKETGMFGTLIIGLPSPHEGGTLCVRFGGEEKQVDFSSAMAQYQLPFAAFYADCEHEIKPVTAGYRLGLVYNLVQKKGEIIPSPDISQQVNQLAALLKEGRDVLSFPAAVLLEHDYTPANYSRHSLKLHDRFRAEALLKAAEKAGYMAHLGLMTHYMHGDLEGDYFYDTYSQSSGEGTMGDEIYEESLSVDYWEPGYPNLGSLQLEPGQVISQKETGTGEPTEKEAEGYTGNAGMTIEYWYHYGAVVLWPRDMHQEILHGASIDVRLSWLRYELDRGTSPDTLLPELMAIRQRIETKLEHPFAFWERALDWVSLIDVLGVFSAHSSIIQQLTPILGKALPILSRDQVVAFFVQLPVTNVRAIMTAAGKTGEPASLVRLMEVIAALRADTRLKSTIQEVLQALPDYLLQGQLQESKGSYSGSPTPRKTIKKCVIQSLSLAPYAENDPAWVDAMTQALHQPQSQDQVFLEQCLLPALVDPALPQGPLHAALKAQLISRFEQAAGEKPQPPANWSLEVPEGRNATAQSVLTMLRSFLESPVDRVFHYQKNQQNRDLVANVLRNHAIDVRFETERKGRPHILKIIKARSAYDDALRDWQTNQNWLARLKEATT
ncbi:MAG: 2OG-Fe(II) oxygenase [Bacteroidetes bacterium]|nr:MAG: 2OG-Fe(II) oxygenase [Bacteroidota bacterium]